MTEETLGGPFLQHLVFTIDCLRRPNKMSHRSTSPRFPPMPCIRTFHKNVQIQSLVWSTAERLRHVQSAIVGRFAVPPNDNRSINGHHHQLNHVAGAPPGLSGIGGDAASAAVAAVAGGIRMSAIFGDALAEAFVRRPFVRFLDALRGITKELPTFGR